MANGPYTEFDDVRCIAETGAALLCVINGMEVWIPKSQLHPQDNEVNGPDDQGCLVITEWLATEKELV